MHSQFRLSTEKSSLARNTCGMWRSFLFLDLPLPAWSDSSRCFYIWNSIKICKFSPANNANGETAIGHYFRGNKRGNDKLVHWPVDHFGVQMASVGIATTEKKKRYILRALLGKLWAAFIQSEQKFRKYWCKLCFGFFTVKPFFV